MQDFGRLTAIIVDFLKRPILIFGYETSLWGIILFTCIAGAIGYVLGLAFDDD